MGFDINAAVAKYVPWDCPIDIEGVSYQTRPVTLGELVAVEQTGKDSMQRLRDTIRGWFVGSAPDLDGWTMDHVQALMGRLNTYAEGRAKKNKPILSKHLANLD